MTALTKERLFPFLRWFPMTGAAFRADLVAGITVAMVLIPQSIAYAGLAGMPPFYGLCTAFVPVIVAALFGSCSQLHTGPVALTSLMTAGVVAQASHALPGSEPFIRTAIALAFVVGIVRVVFGIFGLARLVNLISHPAIIGFTNAAAIVIACSQLNALLGVTSRHGGGFIGGVCGTLTELPSAHIPTMLFGIGSVVALVICRRVARRLPAALTVVVVGTAVSFATGFGSRLNGSIVGDIHSGLPGFVLPDISAAGMAGLLPGALMVAMVGFLEVTSVSKAIAARTRAKLDLDQELVGQGLAAVAGSFFQAFPASGSLSRSALSLQAGARTGVSAIVSAAVVMAVIAFFTPLLHHLPAAVLAAIIIVAVADLVDVRAVIRAWEIRRSDGAVALVTFAATLACAPNVVNGIIVGILLSLVLLISRMMAPRVAVEAAPPAPAGATSSGRVVTVGFEGRLIFTNAAHFEDAVLSARAAHPDATAFVINGESINEIDASGEYVLRRVVDDLRGSGIAVALARLKEPVRALLDRSGFTAYLGSACLFDTVEAARDALAARQQPPA